MFKTKIKKEEKACRYCEKATEANFKRRWTQHMIDQFAATRKEKWLLENQRYCLDHIPAEIMHQYGYVRSSLGGPANTEGQKLMTLDDYVDFMSRALTLTPEEKQICENTPEGEKPNIAARPRVRWVPLCPPDTMKCAEDHAPCAGDKVCYIKMNRGHWCDKHDPKYIQK